MSKLEPILVNAARDGVQLLVLPDACLGGYLSDLRNPDLAELPAALDPDGPELAAVAAMAPDVVVCIGYTESSGMRRYNAAACLSGGRVIGNYRKVHQPAGEELVYAAGDSIAAFDTPAGRIGMLIDYDKTFPEAARALAVDGAQLVAVLSAWPASFTDRAESIPMDRQSRLFNLYDSARAAENQVWLLSSNQTGVQGGLRFLGQAKIVDPSGDIVARTGVKGGLAVADADIAQSVERARRTLHHLEERRPDVYCSGMGGR